MRLTCPMCKKQLDDVPADYQPRPFCSARCKRIDLGNWLTGAYRVTEPVRPDMPEFDELAQRLDSTDWN